MKQQCELKQFIVVNDKVEILDARVFISNGRCREKSRQPRDRKRESVSDRPLLEEKDSVGNKIDR